MGKTLFRLIGAIAMAFVCGMSSADVPVSVGLTISRPKESVTKTGSSKPKRINRRGSSSATEVKNSTYEYSGQIGCNLPKDQTATVTLEAYFITRELGKKGSKEEVSKRTEIDKFEFGGENPAHYKFTFTSPIVEQTTVTTVKTHRSGRGRNSGVSSSTDKDKSGSRFLGVIVRAMHDGKPIKVVAEPSNSKWVAAGKKDTVSLE